MPLPTAYAAAIGSVVLVTLVRLVLLKATYLADVPYLLYAIPVVVGAWLGGWGPGLAATAGGLIGVLAVLIPQEQWLTARTAVGMALFVLQGLVLSYLGAGRLRLVGILLDAAKQLETRVEQRTHELRLAYEKIEREAREREQAHEELRKLAAKLEMSNRELQDFASVASHDLQEPLRKIQAFGDRLSARYASGLGPEGADYIKRMQNAARRMQTLISDLLVLSRVASKAQPFQEVDLKQVAGDVLSDLETRIEEAEARVCVGDLPRIEADPTQMRQLLQNLIGNAIKFQQKGVPPEVNIDATLEAPHAAAGEQGVHGSLNGNGQVLHLNVSDNGIGFDEKYLDKIFTVFQRLHGRGEYEGTGIGLAVCRRIVERHGGTITARSRPGEGSTFTVTLPVHQTQTQGAADAPAT